MKLSLILLIMCLSGFTQAKIQVGTYSGVDNSNNKFEIHIQELVERRGSYIGLLTWETVKEPKVQAFLIDKFSSNKYGLIPLTTQGNYNIAPSNLNPTHALTITSDSLIITSNTDSSSPVKFKTRDKSELRWIALTSGSYLNSSLVISPLDINDESSVSSSITGMAGDFVFRESRANLYLVLPSRLTSTGVKLDKNDQRFVFFLSGTSFRGGGRMFIVDSKTAGAVSVRLK
jgi:hypothetical protein